MMKLSMARLVPLTILVMMSLPLSATSSTADVRGDEFITAMDGNSISGIGPNGIAFNLYFLAGGDVTYSRLGRANVRGTWWMNHDGDVCIKWPERVEALEGCFQMSFDGDTIVWRNKSASGHGKLRGSVVDSVPGPNFWDLLAGSLDFNQLRRRHIVVPGMTLQRIPFSQGWRLCE